MRGVRWHMALGNFANRLGRKFSAIAGTDIERVGQSVKNAGSLSDLARFGAPLRLAHARQQNACRFLLRMVAGPGVPRQQAAHRKTHPLPANGIALEAGK